jgi:hypothetical protein
MPKECKEHRMLRDQQYAI